ncbi:MAG: hypothetical protein IJF41_02095 [Clostridia bacterium]|nr:hypothetical protein [Clostridia bacterium]
MQGIAIAGISLGVLAALSYLPIRIRPWADADLRGGYLHVACRYLFFSITVHYRIDLFQRPWFTLSRISREGHLIPVKRKGKKKQWLDHQEVLNLIRRSKLQELSARLELGIPGEAAATALVCGGVQELIFQLMCFFLPESRDRIRVQVEPDFERGIFQIHFTCMFSVKPVKIVLEIIRIRIRNRQKRKVKSIAPSH